MQTSQVSNAANVLSSPAPAGKQSDANSSAAPFGQVLSREIADRRSASEGTKTQPRETSNAPAARQPARNEAKPADAKSTRETKAKPQDDKAVDASGNIDDAVSQVSEDMLALVANLTQVTTPEAESVEIASTIAEDPTVAVDPALTLAAAGNAIPVDPLAAPMTASVQAADVTSAAPQRKHDTALAGITTIGQMGNTKAELNAATTATTAKASLPQAATSDLIAKGQELLNGTSAGMAAASAAPQDFAAAIKESVSTVTATMAPVQQAALNAAQSMGGNVADKLTPRVGTPAWDQALGQKVVWMVAGEQQSASLTLNPPDLGPLQVVLNVTNSQANATFIAAQPEVRQALEAALPKLRDMLGEAGIQLGQASVNSGNPNQQGSFDQQAASSSRGLGHNDSRGNATDMDAPQVSRVQPASTGQGLVDTFV